MKTNRLFAYILIVLAIVSCRNDDGDVNPGTLVPPRTLAEVALENDSEIKAFLESYTYNYEDFEEPIDPNFSFEIEFQKIEGDNVGKTPLIDFVQTETISVKSEDVGRSAEEGETVDHVLYFLEAVEGKGATPTFADRTITNYEGSLLAGTLFDGRSVPTNQYLPLTLRGYSEGIQNLTGGTGFLENENGTVTFNEFGVGAIFIPSGLAYFDSPPQGSALIKAYFPLVFKVSLLDVEENTDFDEDGIPSLQEDLNGDGNLNNDNTDSEIEALSRVFFPNHNDTDDDQDGILTIDEIKIDGEIKKDANGLVIFPDTDGDGTPDHLDNDN